ncbi:MAG: protein translocase subunit SecF [Alphaproteobacteria bacterium]|nr:protein translocase subunit SecF [Alphaproteobacteria bacterium]
MDFLKDKLTNLNFDFVGWRYIAGTISFLMVVISWVLFVAIGPNFGIDFTGGTEIHLKFEQPVDISEVRGALSSLGVSNDAVQQVGTTEDREFKIRIQDPEFGSKEVRATVENRLREKLGADWIKSSDFNAEVGARLTVTYNGDPKTPADVKQALEGLSIANVSSGREENQVIITLPGLAQEIEKEIGQALGDKQFEVLAIDAVGPKVGAELQRQGFVSVAATLGLVLLYVAFRFDIAFAPGAIIALFHDVSVTIGIFVALQLEFNLPMIGALLTIVGYSLNDTIVIYDRIRENRDRYRRKDTKDLINTSINETLSRTLATSLTTMMAIMMFLVIGGPVIQNFAFAMFLGIVFGTYSTIYVASPMILVMEDVKPHLSKLVAVQAVSDEPEEGADLALSESEKRRRERDSSGPNPAGPGAT